ncbi:hypothetical protein ACFL6W_09535, partial [Thermodesulfobacteriota bacterium]
DEELQVLRKNMADLKNGIADDLQALSSLVTKMEMNNKAEADELKMIQARVNNMNLKVRSQILEMD